MERILKLVRQSGLTFTFIDANEDGGSPSTSIKFKVENDDAASLSGYAFECWMMSKQDVEEIMQYSTLSFDSSRNAVVCTIDGKVLRFPVGTYWTSTRDESDPTKAWCLVASNSAPYLTLTTDDRYNGHFIRAVLDSKSTSGTYFGTDITHRWYTLNVGSSSTNGSGSQLFAWGETESKSTFTIDNYKFGSSMSKYNLNDGATELSHYDGYVDCESVIADDDSILFSGNGMSLKLSLTGGGGSFDIGDLITDETGQSIRDALLELKTEMNTIKNNIGPGGEGGACDTGKRVVLKTADDFDSLTANTVYEVNKDFVLTGSYDVPEGVTFMFAGGSISGGSFSCLDSSTNTYYKERTKRPLLVGDVKFNTANYDIVWNGGFANDEISFEWFNPSLDLTSNTNADLVSALVAQLHDQVLTIGQMYPILKSITISSGSATIQGKTQFQGGYATYVASCNAGFYIVGKLFSAIIQTGGRLNLKSISLVGATSSNGSIYGSRNARLDGSYSGTHTDKYGRSYTISSSASGSEKANSIDFCGFDLRHGNIEIIEDCCINGFCRGLSFDGSKTWQSCTPGFITRCFISCCKWGLYALFVSDFFCTNCKFNSCNSDCEAKKNGVDVSRSIKDQGWVGSESDAHDDFGGGVYLACCSMIQFDACRWEFNYLGIYIDNASNNISVTGSIFDRHTHSILCVYNSPDHWTAGADVFPERHQPATCDILFSGNNILRGLGIRNNWDSSNPTFSPGVAYFCVKSQPDTTTDTTVKASDNLRRVYLTIGNNVFADPMEMRFSGTTDGKYNPANIEYEHSLFMFDCTDNEGVRINSSGNDFRASKATHFVESYNASASANKGCVIIEGAGNTYPEGMIFSTPYYHSTDKQKNSSIVHLNEMFVKDGEFYYYDTQTGGGIQPKHWYGTQAEYSALTKTYPQTEYNIY